jgi:hypothetical protein
VVARVGKQGYIHAPQPPGAARSAADGAAGYRPDREVWDGPYDARTGSVRTCAGIWRTIRHVGTRRTGPAMSASNQVPGFTPGGDGFHFINSWPSEPDIVMTVPPFGQVAIGEASNGLCGGMVFAVRDFFEARLPIVPDTVQPAGQSPLFNYIVGRLIDSFNIPGGVLEYFSWMNTPDHDTGIWLATRHGVAWMTIEQEWPVIRSTIDSGHPCPLGLVTVQSVDPAQLGKNHQVMAYAYGLDDAGNLTIKVYDPNTSPASADQVQMSLNISDPSRTTPISHNIAIGFPVRGFFHVNYTPHDPGAL